MNERTQRIVLYAATAAIVSGLGLAVVFQNREADVATLLSSADVQLRLAYGIPAVDQQGVSLSSRDAMIVQAEQCLADVERRQPGMAVTAEFAGFARMLRADYAGAAAHYERARRCEDVQPEQFDILAFNQARMLAKAGQRQEALAVFAGHAAALDARYGHQRRLEEAALLRQLGQRDAARERLAVVARDADAEPLASLQAAQEYLELGELDAAEGLLQRLGDSLAIADYHRARLKLQRGEVDTSLELLGRAKQARPAEVKRLLVEDAGAWSAVAKQARFQELSGTPAATPLR